MEETGDVFVTTEITNFNISQFSQPSRVKYKEEISKIINKEQCQSITLQWENENAPVTEKVNQTIQDVNDYFKNRIGIQKFMFFEGKNMPNEELIKLLANV